ncbi:MAG: SDR family NAD(P)-dependent oxidoreductase, partial [Chloroflexi bacterium]|nr:SDR family NAD(P)-dependent oxidoreductase [Chloroflexota bacterium]
MRLKGKVALITGGAAGIGKATVKIFIEQGANVYICDLDQTAGEKTAAEFRCNFSVVDVSDRAAVQDWVDRIVEEAGRIDILVN